MKNSVAILIPTKNRRELLEKALQSVFEQSVSPEEIIIVNDGSTDDTGSFLSDLQKKKDNISVITREKSGGVNTARNQGIKLAKSEWIVFLDDDDALVPTAVSKIKEKLSRLEGNLGVVFFNTKIRSEKGEYVGGFQFEQGELYDPSYEEVMTKFGLKGDCKPVFLKSIFNSGKYWFPETVNGFESVTIRKIVHDGIKIRYYKDISTIVNQYGDVEHLSFSAPAKNPKAYLLVHLEDLSEHKDFYAKNISLLVTKYREMSKLAFRAKMYFSFLRFYFLSIVTRLK